MKRVLENCRNLKRPSPGGTFKLCRSARFLKVLIVASEAAVPGQNVTKKPQGINEVYTSGTSWLVPLACYDTGTKIRGRPGPGTSGDHENTIMKTLKVLTPL